MFQSSYKIITVTDTNIIRWSPRIYISSIARARRRCCFHFSHSRRVSSEKEGNGERERERGRRDLNAKANKKMFFSVETVKF